MCLYLMHNMCIDIYIIADDQNTVQNICAYAYFEFLGDLQRVQSINVCAINKIRKCSMQCQCRTLHGQACSIIILLID